MMSIKYDTVLFDLDGTLLNTLTDLKNGVNYALETLGQPKRTEEEIRVFIGDGSIKLLERSLTTINDESDIKKAVELFREHYTKHQTDYTVPYDGINDLLNVLREKGVNTAIVSNKKDSNVKALAKHFFPHNILYACGTVDFAKRKPNPFLLDETIKHFGAQKSNVLYVGDSENDLLAAKNANVDCVCVSYGFRSREQLKGFGADIIVDNAKEILKYIIQENT